ncbi:MAG: hypothetical protein R2713_11180 [Ilumatobacteraceae bacterium]
MRAGPVAGSPAPWIFSGGIAARRRPGAGDTVLVEDDAGRALGWGA